MPGRAASAYWAALRNRRAAAALCPNLAAGAIAGLLIGGTTKRNETRSRSRDTRVGILAADHLVCPGATLREAPVAAAAVMGADLLEVIFVRLDDSAAAGGELASFTPGCFAPTAPRLRLVLFPLLPPPLALLAAGVGVVIVEERRNGQLAYQASQGQGEGTPGTGHGQGTGKAVELWTVHTVLLQGSPGLAAVEAVRHGRLEPPSPERSRPNCTLSLNKCNQYLGRRWLSEMSWLA